MIEIRGENPGDWIALCAANAVSWGRRVARYIKDGGACPPWARIPPDRGSIRYRNDAGTDVWTFGDGSDIRDEGSTFDMLRGDCDTLMAAGAGARLAMTGRARIVTVERGGRGHTFETRAAMNIPRGGYELLDMSVYGGMKPLDAADYNIAGNIADIEAVHGGYTVRLQYNVRPLVIDIPAS